MSEHVGGVVTPFEGGQASIPCRRVGLTDEVRIVGVRHIHVLSSGEWPHGVPETLDGGAVLVIIGRGRIVGMHERADLRIAMRVRRRSRGSASGGATQHQHARDTPN